MQGDIHAAQARSDEQKDPAKAHAGYLNAWRYYSFGAWPTQNSEGKRRANRLGLEAFRGLCAHFHPHDGDHPHSLRGKGDRRISEVAHDVKASSARDRHRRSGCVQGSLVRNAWSRLSIGGPRYLALDMPGTNEAPVMADAGAERMFSRAIDYLLTRKDIDPKRIGVVGGSWGGHWARASGYRRRTAFAQQLSGVAR